MEPHWKVWFQHLPVIATKALWPTDGMCITGTRFPDRLKPKDKEGKILDWRVHLTCMLVRYEQPVRPPSRISTDAPRRKRRRANKQQGRGTELAS
jgi:hypothetical protein